MLNSTTPNFRMTKSPNSGENTFRASSGFIGPLFTMISPFPVSIAFKTACELVFHGRNQPSGYTEPILHLNRLLKKI